MGIPLRTLIVEDRLADAELMLHELRRAGLAVDWQRVETEADFVAALEPTLDLILADYTLPQFTGLRALQLLQERGFDIPFIVVTGSISEEVAVECMKQGAADYLLKDRMTRLGQAATHALEQKRLRDENRRAAEALRASEQKYRRLHESMIDGFAYVDMDGRILDSNPSFQQMLGYRAEELARLTYLDLTPEKWHAAERVILDEQILTRGYSDIYQKEYRRKDGTVFPIEVHTFLIKNEAGENEGMWAIVRDITERKRAEDALHASEERYRLIAENTGDVIWTLDLAAGRFSYVSPSVVKLRGYTVEEVLAQPVAAALTPESNRYITTNLPSRIAAVEAGDESARTNITEVDQPCRDGSIVQTEVVTTLLNDAQGHVVSVLGISRDITARKQAEDALRDSEARFRQLFTTSPDAILLLDPHAADVPWPIVDCNEVASQMNGYTREELIGQSIDLLNVEGEIRVDRQTYLDRLRREGVLHIEDVHRHKDGHVFPIEVSTSLLTLGGRELVLGIDRDVTARKQAESQREAALAAVGQAEKHFRSLIENAPDGIVLIAPDGTFKYVSPSARRIFGYDAEDAMNLDPMESTHPDDLPAVLAALNNLIQDPAQVPTLQYRFHHRDGGWRWIESTFSNLLAEPSVEAIVINFHDISDRKQAESQREAALEVSRESERRERERATELQTIMDAVPAAIWIARDPICQVITGNRAAYELVRMPPGSNASRTAPENQGLIHTRIYHDGVELPPQDLALQTSAATGIEIRDLEQELVFDNGTIVHELGNVMPLFDDQGYPRGAVGAFIDITARKQAEQAVRASQQLLEKVLYSLRDAVFVLDAQTVNILDCNPASSEIFGYARDELLGRTTDFLHADQAALEEFRRQLNSDVHEAGFLQNLEFTMKRRDGTIFPTEHSVSPLADTAGNRAGWVSVVRDITERKRAEAERGAALQALRESEELLSLFIKHSPVYAFIKNVTPTESRVLIASENYQDMIGIPGSEMIGKTMEELFPAEIAAKFTADDWAVVSTGQVLKLDEDLNGRNYTTIKFPIVQGSRKLLAGYTIDITERQQATKIIRLNQVRLQTAQAVGHVGSWEYDFASSKVWGSEESFRIFGLPPADSELDLADLAPLIPEWETVYHTLVEMGTASGKYAFEFAIQPAGDTPPRVVVAVGELVKDAQGQPVKSVGVLQDITARKQAEEQLRNAERFAHATVDALSAHLCVLDENGVILTVNQAWHDFAQANPPVPPHHFLGVNYLEVCDAVQGPDATEAAAFADGLRAVMRGDSDQFTLEYPCDAPWEKRWFTGRVTRFLGEGPLRIVIVHEDITERKQMEARLRDKVVTLQALTEIDREITSATELQGILDLVCRRAAELVHAPKSAILTHFAEKMVMSASHGLRDATRVGAEFARVQQAGMMNFTVLKTRQTRVLNNITSDNPFLPETIKSEQVHALAIIPLSADEDAIGALTVFDTTPRQWQADELQILALLAGQTAIALEKMRLFEANRARAAQLAMLNEIGQAITSSLNLDLVLVTLLDKVRRATSAEASAVALVDVHSGELVFQQAMGGAAHAVLGLRLPPGEGIVGWVAQHRQSVLVADATSDTRLHPLENTAGFVTHNLVCVPLLVRDTVTGVIELVNSRRGGFGQDDVQLLESVAAQAAIVIENVRLFETEHAGRERLDTLYRIGQAINSTLDANTILDRLTDEAVLATQATHGSALVAHPERKCFERRSLRGYSAEQAAAALTDELPLASGLNGRAYRLHQPVYIDDVATDPDYHPLIPTTRSELAVPIVRGGQVIGNLDLQSPVVKAFHDIDLQFLQALTDQVAIALENARLFAATQRQMDELTIVTQVALVGAAGRPFDETVARATDALSRLWPEAALGFLFVDETGQTLSMHSSYLNPTPVPVPMTSVGLDQGLTGWAARQQRPIRVGDVTTDSRYVAKSLNIRSEMVAPLVVGMQLIGVVNVETPAPDAFSGDDLRLLTTLAGQLAVIFEKARLDAVLLEHTAHLEQRVQERTAEIRREQARTQAILDALGEGVVVTDLQGTIQYLNQAMELLTGYSINESLGQNPRLWQSGQTPPEVYEAMWSAVLGGQTWRGEIVNRRKDGELYFASLAAAPIPTTTNSGEPFAGFVGIQRDITERKRAEEEMQRALEKERELNNLKSNFVSLTSHEFRTPLTTILSSAEMLEHYGVRWTEERKQEHLQRIQTSVKYMTGLLDDVLVVAKAEANRLEFVPAPLDLLKFCRGLVEAFELTDNGNHTLRFNAEADCAQVNMDEQLLRHILSNLLSNALKYSPPGSGVQFDLACRAGQAVFRIQDHGRGIPLEDQARLFETFHRASNVRNIAGTGLGLTIVKRSVDLYGGTIEIVSQVDLGTTVTVSLPTGTPDNG
jgi:PAS domain S-box-containing protein